jgi:hypothetical protein
MSRRRLVRESLAGSNSRPVVPVAPAGSGYVTDVKPSFPYDPDRHHPDSVAARGRCSWHGTEGTAEAGCEGEPVVSFQDRRGHWQSGCQRALEDLVDREEIEPLGQGA